MKDLRRHSTLRGGSSALSDLAGDFGQVHKLAVDWEKRKLPLQSQFLTRLFGR